MNQSSTLTTSFLFASSVFFSSLSMAEGLLVVQDFTLEAKISVKKEAPSLVLFMSKSCVYCEKVLQDFLLPMQRDHAYDDKVILRQIETGSTAKLIDFDGKVTTHRAFSIQHKASAVPTVMLFDGRGRMLTQIVGLLTADYYLAYLDIAINESQDKIKAAAK